MARLVFVDHSLNRKETIDSVRNSTNKNPWHAGDKTQPSSSHAQSHYDLLIPCRAMHETATIQGNQLRRSKSAVFYQPSGYKLNGSKAIRQENKGRAPNGCRDPSPSTATMTRCEAHLRATIHDTFIAPWGHESAREKSVNGVPVAAGQAPP